MKDQYKYKCKKFYRSVDTGKKTTKKSKYGLVQTPEENLNKSIHQRLKHKLTYYQYYMGEFPQK